MRTSSSSPIPVPRRRAALITTTAALALVLGACSGPDDEEAPQVTGAAVPGTAVGADPADGGADDDGVVADGPRYARYVALGDSFAALGPTGAPTSGPEACHRSSRNYAALLADDSRVGELVDVTCGGAETEDMTGRQIAGTPPQFDALTAETDLITLSIGGNDIGFGPIVDCIVQTPQSATGAPCRDRLELTVTSALDGLGARLDGVYAGIAERSPGARIVTTGYLPLVPADGGCAFVSRMSPGDVTWVRHVTERINRVVTDAAERAGADTMLPEDAQERSACAPPTTRYTDFLGVETGSHPMHLTAAGHRAMADAVAAVL